MENHNTHEATEAVVVDGTSIEEPPAPSTQLVRRERRSEVLHPLDRQQLVASFREYQELCKELLDDSDYQAYTQREKDANGSWQTVEKRFKKKSAWRKLATAFDLDVQIVDSKVERDPQGNALRASVIARAIAPSGRYQDGDGYCSSTEPRFMRDKGREKLENDLRGTACVPLRAEILTREGFRAYNEVREGEPVLAYDVASDLCRWTPLRRVSVYRDAQLVKVGNRQSWSMVCTPDHTWAVEHDKPRLRVAQRVLARAERLPARGRLVNAAPAETGPNRVCERDAALVGWLITDGRVTWDAFYPRAMIYQSKDPYVEELRMMIGDEAREDFDDRPPRTFPTGRTYAVKRAFRWALTTDALKGLMERTRVYSPRDLIAFVTQLDAAGRRAMLDAMLKAEGYRRGAGWVFSQVRREVLDVFEILATLEGRALGRERREGKLTRVTLRSSRATDIPALMIEPEFPEAVWCPTTDYGTWVMRLDGLVSITGNTTRGKNRAIADLLGTGEVSAEEMSGEAGNDQMPQGPVYGQVVPSEIKADAINATVRLCGGDLGQAKALWEQLQGALDGYMPHAAAIALIHAASRTPAAPEPSASGRAQTPVIDGERRAEDPQPAEAEGEGDGRAAAVVQEAEGLGPHASRVRATGKARGVEPAELANLIRVAAGSKQIAADRAAGQLPALLARVTEPIAARTLELIDMLHPEDGQRELADAPGEVVGVDFGAFEPPQAA